MRSLEQWLSYQAQAHPQTIDLGLERLERVLERLHWRQPNLPVVTIAGTNGKGSVAAYCSAILSAAGLRTGTFTSPHLRDYRERIQLGGEWVDSADLLSAFEKIEAARGDVSLTFFEYNTLAALLVFEAAALDAWVLEVGMGGRLDAVNVVDPTVAVITSIGLDHQEFLGTSFDAIAREKAGIMRAQRAAVFGSREMPPAIEAIAGSICARLKRLGADYRYARQGRIWRYHGSRWELPELPPPALWGAAQYDNAAAAIAALEEIEGVDISPAAVAEGLLSASLLGRFQLLPAQDSRRPAWILDVAHNPHAARVLAANLRALTISGRTLAVCGILADKDAAGIVEELRDCIDEWWFVPTEGERGMSGADLQKRVAAHLKADSHAAASIGAACAAASAAAEGQDRIVVFGSFHTVGPALDWLEASQLHSPPLPEYTAARSGH
jgi:dihydrofolate synthase / folylpolyglutamate synthase